MKLPQLTAERSLMPSIMIYGLKISSDRLARALAPMVDIGCLQGCVGSGTAAYCLHCGEDMDCWAKCAGKSSPACVGPCYQSG